MFRRFTKKKLLAGGVAAALAVSVCAIPVCASYHYDFGFRLDREEMPQYTDLASKTDDGPCDVHLDSGFADGDRFDFCVMDGNGSAISSTVTLDAPDQAGDFTRIQYNDGENTYPRNVKLACVMRGDSTYSEDTINGWFEP